MDKSTIKNRGIEFLDQAYGKWWMMLLEGVCLIIICGLTLFMPQVTLGFLVMVIGIYRIAMGIFYCIVSIANRVNYGNNGGFGLARGIVDLLVGAIFLMWPSSVVSIFVILVGLWAVIMGIIVLVSGGGSTGIGKIVKIIVGVLLIVFGIFTFINPVEQAVVFLIFMGIVLGILGVFFVIQSFSMKKAIAQFKKLQEGYKDYDIR
ncbi:MAG: DUF308 domain-containing protein [Eubacterium sp.]